MKKKWYQKFKVMTALATIVLEIIILVVVQIMGKTITPEIMTIMKMVFGIGVALMTGHTITDSVAAIGKSSK